MSGRARVLVWYVAPGDDPGAVERAYDQISGDLAGTPGLLGNELLRRLDDPLRVMVMSEWESLASFQKWEQGIDHRPATSPLRPYADRYEIYEVVSAF
ncbi:antibiotic biosynthesis monooxygenase [Nonomuraea antimicrobica]|uniref:Antibiotic biosynthesis monooxygenase n=1 Tax=Nonomuraea antimicrobica TaxID=561173 RepID=A0ABP7DAE3_9ACTN